MSAHVVLACDTDGCSNKTAEDGHRTVEDARKAAAGAGWLSRRIVVGTTGAKPRYRWTDWCPQHVPGR